LAALLSGLGIACKSHVQADARVAAATEDDDRRWEIPEPATSAEMPASPANTTAAPPPQPTPSPGPSFVGVTHDLSLAPSASREAACRCLAIAYGPLSDERFAWAVDRPSGAAVPWALAISAEGVACDATGFDPLRASIAGIERQGSDVVVTVENVEQGRPVMRGALIVPPAPGGAIVVRSLRGAPYGAPPAGGPGPCRVATPP